VRARPALPLVVLALGLAGCGRDGDEEPREEDAVRATLTTYAKATARGDAARICRDVLATALVERIQRQGVTCGEAVQAGLTGVRDPRLRVESVQVDGTRATAQVRSTAAGQPPSQDTIRLVREKAGWRIAALGR